MKTSMHLVLLVSLTLGFLSCADKFKKQGALPSEGRDLLDEFQLESNQLEKFKEVPLAEAAVEEITNLPDQQVPTVPLAKNNKDNKKTQSNKLALMKSEVGAKNEAAKSKNNKKNSSQDQKNKVDSNLKMPSSINENLETPLAGAEKEKSIKEENLQTEGMANYPADYPEAFKEYDRVSIKIWQKFKPIMFPGEILKFKLKYFGVVCGTITLNTLPITKIGNKKTYHLLANLKSAPFYKYLYTLDDYIETYVEAETFLPVKYTLIQRESGQIADDLQLFDREKLKTFFWFKGEKKGEIKKIEESSYVPQWSQDSFSALFFVRGLPLNVGDKFELPIVTRAKIWILKVLVDKKEEITINGKKIKAIKLKAETHYPGILKKKGDILFWYSDDARHRLLKFSARVKIGVIDGEIFEEPNED